MDEIIIQLEKKLYRKLMLLALQNHTTVSDVISECLIKTLYTEENKKQRPVEVTKKLYQMYQVYSPYLNEWETNFISSLIENPFQLSDKQIKQVDVIIMKYPQLIEQLDI